MTLDQKEYAEAYVILSNYLTKSEAISDLSESLINRRMRMKLNLYTEAEAEYALYEIETFQYLLGNLAS